MGKEHGKKKKRKEKGGGALARKKSHKTNLSANMTLQKYNKTFEICDILKVEPPVSLFAHQHQPGLRRLNFSFQLILQEKKTYTSTCIQLGREFKFSLSLALMKLWGCSWVISRRYTRTVHYESINTPWNHWANGHQCRTFLAPQEPEIRNGPPRLRELRAR